MNGSRPEARRQEPETRDGGGSSCCMSSGRGAAAHARSGAAGRGRGQRGGGALQGGQQVELGMKEEGLPWWSSGRL